MFNLTLNFLFLLYFTLNNLNLVYGNLKFNSECISKNLNGRCIDIETCKPHARAFKNLPDRLDYFPVCNRKLRYVCCPLSPGQIEITSTTTRKPPSKVRTPKPEPDERISAISEKFY